MLIPRLSAPRYAALVATLVVSWVAPAAAGETKLVPEDGIEPDNFGNSVALSADTLVVGSPLADANDNGGAAYVYVREGLGMWSNTAQIAPVDGAHLDHFAGSVGLSGETAVFGAMFDKEEGVSSGSAYIYHREGMGMWKPQGKLLPSDAHSSMFFGCSVAIDGDTALIGAYNNDKEGKFAGAAFIFTRDDKNVWSEAQQLTADDAGSSDRFGSAVALEGDRLVVGAPTDSAGEFASGSVYVFTRDNMGVWTQEEKLLGSGITKSANLGTSVALDGDRVIAGAPGYFHMGAYTGAAYLWHHDGIGWGEEERLVASDGKEGVYFGHSVTLHGERAVIGTINDNDKGKWAGAAYVFEHAGDVWTESEKLFASDATDSTSLGSSVASDPGTIVAGASGGNATYVFEGILGAGLPCEADEACKSGFCVDSVCCAQECGGGEGDCQACSVAAGSSVDGACEALAAAVECRAAVDVCDQAEVCDGRSALCPEDESLDDGAECRGGVCQAGVCEPAGTTGSTGDPTGTGGDSSSTTGGGSSGTGFETGEDPTAGGTGLTTSSVTTATSGGSGESGDSATDSGGGIDEDGGCGCTAEVDNRGALSSLLLLAAFGLRRRRR